ncbi:MAG TPA: DUF3817 domain-containing protein [Candidatus Saccharimonadales bacterium]|nr:DUF3817 domain-containing protein [Candidatus Saccharimonadales bacterium]
MLNKLIKKYEGFKPFTENEAWALFRLSAIGETVGWTLLIAGILIGRYLTPGNGIAVQIAGHIHGTLFLIYIAAVIVCGPSQGWSRRRILVAAVASVPLYGSLVFEQVVAHMRLRTRVHRSLSLSVYYSWANPAMSA